MQNKWKRVRTNLVLEGEGFVISFLEHDINPWVGTGFDSDDNSSETALVKDENYYILNGDFREQYEPLVEKGFDACKSFYDANKEEFGSTWSSDE